MTSSDIAPLPAVQSDLPAEIARLAARYRRANGPVIVLMNRLGGRIEDRLGGLPPDVRARIDSITRSALERGYHLAASGRHAPDLGPRGPMALAALTGAAGGAGGLATSIAELPVTITVILHAIRRAAADEGFDPDDPAIRLEALRVFAAGSPLATDDGVNTGFLGARMVVTGPALQRVLAGVAPRLATALGQKLMAQAVPVLGAVAGAGLSAAFLGYYREVAHVRFGLLRLAERHGAEKVIAAFGKAVQPVRVTRG
ncbi:MAG: EcsC family protein [Rhodobacter sp.]|nr:EcsC family protein [Rhodobacter sp.]MCA3513349.1 EcsC family protein [Rhodobacter sp.]MCA3521775.1 EcsC family protein [Rhodobacter sp.]MCA3524727.1 EcsC family protein [Rhodobacter sp.]MCA3527712.1 EcsC family protein [Rhodobacter sp.]